MGADKKAKTATFTTVPEVNPPSNVQSRPKARAPSARTPGRNIEQLCREQGIIMTTHRRIVARVLADAKDHPGVKEVYRRALLFDGSVCIATVYRTVRLFEEKGIIQRSNFSSKLARYRFDDHGRRYHLIDVDSGEVLEFSGMMHEWLIHAAMESLGFEILSLRLEVFGKQLNVQHRSRTNNDKANSLPPGRRR